MIDWDITKTETGFDKDYFDKYHASSRKVYAICNGCGRSRWLSQSDYTDLCQLCGVRSENNRELHRNIMLKRYEDPKEHKKTSDALKNSNKHQDTIRSKARNSKISKSQKKRYEDPKERKKTGDAIKNSKNRRKEMVFELRICKTCEENFMPTCGTNIYCEKCYTGDYCYKFDPKCKEQNREKYNRECFICGLSESENITSTGIPWRLLVHHIDMNKMQGCDDIDWNLIPVCIHCHNKLHSEIWRDRILYILKLIKVN